MVLRFLVMFALALHGPTIFAQKLPSLRVCAADIVVPPFLFWDHISGDAKTPNSYEPSVHGYSMDVLTRIAQKLNLQAPKIQLLPMPRCIKEVRDGQFDVILNVLPNQGDLKPLLVSNAYYDLHSHYFYSRKAHPQGIQIKSLQELKNYRVCGLYGYTYEEYGLGGSNLDMGARDYKSLILKLHANRCDIFIERREIWAGLYLIDSDLQHMLQDPNLEDAPLPEQAPLQFHIALSRRLPNANALLVQINDTISQLRASRELDQMMEAYIH